VRKLNDKIFIEGIKFHGFHGLTRLERKVGVRLSVDVYVETCLKKSGVSDEVRDTLDYRKIHLKIMKLGRETSHKLLESFATMVMDELFRSFRQADKVTLKIRKETPVLDGIVDSVGVQITRTREEVIGK
jgi:dihydroneopterin aldolase